jgi:hypothetical protein
MFAFRFISFNRALGSNFLGLIGLFSRPLGPLLLLLLLSEGAGDAGPLPGEGLATS